MISFFICWIFGHEWTDREDTILHLHYRWCPRCGKVGPR